MKKTDNLIFRLSAQDKELIERTAAMCGFDKVSKFILAVLIPYCCKVESNKNKVD